MIVWDFNAIMALGLGLSITTVALWWLLYTFRRPQLNWQSQQEFIQQCSFCSHMYLDYLKKKPKHCPQCGSYHD